MDEWLSLFDDPILGNSALDRLANASYQIVIEGTSYRERLSPHHVLLGTKARLYAKSTKGNRYSRSGVAPYAAGAGGFFTIRSFPRHLRTPGCPYHPLSIVLAHST